MKSSPVVLVPMHDVQFTKFLNTCSFYCFRFVMTPITMGLECRVVFEVFTLANLYVVLHCLNIVVVYSFYIFHVALDRTSWSIKSVYNRLL